MKTLITILKIVPVLLFALLLFPGFFGIAAAASYPSLYSGGYISAHNFPAKGELTVQDVPSQLDYTINVQNTSRPRSFRVYVPPGAKFVMLTLYTTQAGYVGAAVRLGFPPQCIGYDALTSSSPNPDYYVGFPWNPGDDGASLRRLRQEDFQEKNTGGHIHLVSDYPSNYTTGEWIYVRILFNKDAVAVIKFIVNIDKAVFVNWYNKNASRDPQPLTRPVQGVTNCVFESTISEPEPDPVEPQPTNSGINRLKCWLMSGKWVNGKCIPPEPVETVEPEPIVHDPSECNYMWSIPGVTLKEKSGLSMAFKDGEDAECPYGLVVISAGNDSAKWTYTTTKDFLTIIDEANNEYVFAKMHDGSWILVYAPQFILEL